MTPENMEVLLLKQRVNELERYSYLFREQIKSLRKSNIELAEIIKTVLKVRS